MFEGIKLMESKDNEAFVDLFVLDNKWCVHILERNKSVSQG